MGFESKSLTNAFQAKKAPQADLTRINSPEDPKAKARSRMANITTPERKNAFVGQVPAIHVSSDAMSRLKSNIQDGFGLRDIKTKASNDSTGQPNDNTGQSNNKSFHEIFKERMEKRQSLPYFPDKLPLSKGQEFNMSLIDLHANPQELSKDYLIPFLEARGIEFGAHTGKRAVQKPSFSDIWAREVEKQQGFPLSEDQKNEISNLTRSADLSNNRKKLRNLETQYMSPALRMPYGKTVEQISLMNNKLPDKVVNNTVKLHDKNLKLSEAKTIKMSDLSSHSFSKEFNVSVEVSTSQSEDHFVCKKVYELKAHLKDIQKTSWKEGEEGFNMLVGTKNIKSILETIPTGHTVESLTIKERSHRIGENSYKLQLNFKQVENA